MSSPNDERVGNAGFNEPATQKTMPQLEVDAQFSDAEDDEMPTPWSQESMESNDLAGDESKKEPEQDMMDPSGEVDQDKTAETLSEEELKSSMKQGWTNDNESPSTEPSRSPLKENDKFNKDERKSEFTGEQGKVLKDSHKVSDETLEHPNDEESTGSSTPPPSTTEPIMSKPIIEEEKMNTPKKKDRLKRLERKEWTNPSDRPVRKAMPRRFPTRRHPNQDTRILMDLMQCMM